MEEASNGKVKEALQKVEGVVKEDAEYVVDSVKELVKELMDGESEAVAKESEDRKDASWSSSSDEEKEEDPREDNTENAGPVAAVEETVEEVSETVVDSTIAESEPSGSQEQKEVPEVEYKEEEVAIVASSEGKNVVEVTEAVTEQISETTLLPPVETKAEPAPTSSVLPIQDESRGDLAPKESEDPPPQPPAAETPVTTVNPPIIPVSHRVLHPTSWRSCCGLFDALRRSNR
ncbi:enolase-phosphatase E1 isoform X1 [Punica granatum]|uniref:Enolase-phosphatase E1 isoform X1 n=1 Tax=Punica granatum TaxID=22663 RepID=A0A6P8D4F3_PUNGR|nr:enolase-phosphatase E1 isoform X1 [Punica granatum]XP_031391354.1 enolase-phosphatase E1 isoform X1 [Punica granatum]XP_031391355.1 enolase-phosphatase E1 isoform X1 [Punica granatum]